MTALLIALLLLSSVSPAQLALGDVSRDAVVDIIDALYVARHDAGLISLAPDQLVAADVDLDGRVSILDALHIARFVVGVDTLPPSGGGPPPPASGWVPAGFGGAGNFLSVHFDPQRQGVVHVASDVSGVLRSTDAGVSWEIRSRGLGNFEISSLAIDPQHSDTLYAGVGALTGSRNTGLFVSHDAGATWQVLAATRGQGFTYRKYRTVEAIAVHPTQPTTLIAGTREQGLWRSTSAGGSWTRVQSAPSVSPPPPNSMLDAGSVPDDPAPYVAPVSAVRFAPDAPSVVYAAFDGHGVLKSTDAGATWSLASSGLPSRPAVRHLAVGSGGVLLAALGEQGVYRSTNAGATWQSAGGSLPPLSGDHWVSSVALHPGNSSIGYLTLFSYDHSPVWKTTNGGATWQPLMGGNVTLDQTNDPTNAWRGSLQGYPDPALFVAVDPFNPQHLFITTFWTLYRSTDGGATWAQAIRGAQDTCVTDIAVDTLHAPGAPDLLYCTHMDAGLLLSRDLGATWETVLPPAGTYENAEPLAGQYWQIAIFQVGNTKNLLVTMDPWSGSQSKVLRSAGGAAWTEVLSLPWAAGAWTDGGLVGLAADPSGSGVVYVTQDGGQVLRSSQSGVAGSWAPTSGQPAGNSFSHALVVDDAGRVFAGTIEDGLYRSTSGGASWQRVLVQEDTIFGLATAPGATYATGLVDLYRTTDGGTTWTAITSLPAHPDPDGVGDEGLSVAVDPANASHIVFARGDNWHAVDASVVGVVESWDAGSTWSPINDGLGLLGVNDLTFGSNGTILAGTWCGGTWRLSRAP